MMDTTILTKANRGIELLIKYHDCWNYADFADAGNACYKPYRDDNLDAVNELIAAVRSEMPKHGARHIELSEVVAKDVGVKWVSYDFLCKATARILASIESLEDFRKQCEFARFVKQRMKEKIYQSSALLLIFTNYFVYTLI